MKTIKNCKLFSFVRQILRSGRGRGVLLLDEIVHRSLLWRNHPLPIDLIFVQHFIKNCVVSVELELVPSALVQQSPNQAIVHADRKRMRVDHDNIPKALREILLRHHRQSQTEAHGPQIARVGQPKATQVKYAYQATVRKGSRIKYVGKVRDEKHGMFDQLVVRYAMLPERPQGLVERPHVVDQDARVFVLWVRGPNERMPIKILNERELLKRQRI